MKKMPLILAIIIQQLLNTSNARCDDLDELLGESYEAGSLQEENKLIEQLSSISLKYLEREFPTGFVPRDVHAKSHGCLFGEMRLDNRNLPDFLKAGIFSENRDYQIVLRYSSNDKDRHLKDKKQDIRGLGLKVMNVNQTKGQSQDFLFLAHEAFFIKNNAFYVEFLSRLMSNNVTAFLWLAWNDFSGALKIARDRISTEKNYDNPLDIPFFSAVPARLGGDDNPDRRAVKYRVTRAVCDPERVQDSRESRASRANRNLDPNFLRTHLRSAMEQGDACLSLAVQVRRPEDRDLYPVEDASIAWKTPYLEVARVKLPVQDFDSPEMNTYCENLSFDPWRSLPEHRPLGRINRARKKIYSVIAKYRHTRNGIIDTYQEPTDSTIVKY